ncbi:hypothetical protein AVEN_145172-1, partial [Araneus ventricosus]
MTSKSNVLLMVWFRSFMRGCCHRSRFLHLTTVENDYFHLKIAFILFQILTNALPIVWSTPPTPSWPTQMGVRPHNRIERKSVGVVRMFGEGCASSGVILVIGQRLQIT